MARTLSDALIVAMIESATRLTSGRGPISGATPAQAMAQSGGPPPVETSAPAQADAAAGQTGAAAEPAPATETPAGAQGGAQGGPQGGAQGGDRDTRSAEQIAADFKTIYTQLEALVRVSAEQETPRVGFGVR
jgi:hypothetical protein